MMTVVITVALDIPKSPLVNIVPYIRSSSSSSITYFPIIQKDLRIYRHYNIVCLVAVPALLRSYFFPLSIHAYNNILLHSLKTMKVLILLLLLLLWLGLAWKKSFLLFLWALARLLHQSSLQRSFESMSLFLHNFTCKTSTFYKLS